MLPIYTVLKTWKKFGRAISALPHDADIADVLAPDRNTFKNCNNVPGTFYSLRNSALFAIPSEGNVSGELVNLSLVCQAFAVPAQEFQAIIVGVDRVGKAFPSPLESYECLCGANRACLDYA